MQRTKLPQWSTPERRSQLVRLHERKLGQCIYRCSLGCMEPRHDYEHFVAELREEWVRDDRDAARYQRFLNSHPLISRFELGSFGGTWTPHHGEPYDPVKRDVHVSERPDFYVVGYSYDALRDTTVLTIRISGSYMRLHIDVGAPFSRLSRNKRKKVRRTGAGVPVPAQQEINEKVRQAVLLYRKV